MFKTGDTLHLSASDLIGHLNCRHLSELDLQAANGKLERPHYHDPLLEILSERGALHERSYLEHLAPAGWDTVQIEGVGVLQPQVDQTLSEMRAGRQVIAQGALRNGTWGGRTDILRRVEAPSGLGDWSYEVIDTKLARETKAGAVLQLSLYSDLLSAAQGRTPELMHVVTPGLLLRQRPQLGGDLLHSDGETTVEAAVRIAPKLASGVLAIQGPPGAGKTFTAARMICALVRAHKRVGVTANSHKVIRNLLDETVRAADELGILCTPGNGISLQPQSAQCGHLTCDVSLRAHRLTGAL